MKITFFVPGIPKTAGSKRGIPIYRGKKGHKQFTSKVVVVEDCKKSADWRGDVIKFATEAIKGIGAPITGPVSLEVCFCFTRPKSHYGTGRNKKTIKPSAPTCHTKKPDITKLLRAVEDALTGIVCGDDSQIIRQLATKDYASVNGADIEIETAKNFIKWHRRIK